MPSSSAQPASNMSLPRLCSSSSNATPSSSPGWSRTRNQLQSQPGRRPGRRARIAMEGVNDSASACLQGSRRLRPRLCHRNHSLLPLALSRGRPRPALDLDPRSPDLRGLQVHLHAVPLYHSLYRLLARSFRPNRKIKPMPLPAYPEPKRRNELFLVLGEVHDPRKPIAAEHPYWLTVPERGLFTGIAIFGAIGTGKTSGCMYPYAEQLISYRADDTEKRIGGLVLEVKGDFCHKVEDILKRHGREGDYTEVNLNADYRYNPLYIDLDAYALAYNIASLLNHLFGKGKEPFWQQAYTNLVKFIIQLHKVAYDYVTLFDVYECAINPELLEKRIHEAERMLKGGQYLVISSQDFRAHPELECFGFLPDDPVEGQRAPQSPALEE